MVNKNSCTVFALQFEEKFIKILKDLKRLKNDGSLMFQQVPTVEIDGMKLVQTRAILNYIASKYNLYGKDMKERALYNEVPVLKNGYHKKALRTKVIDLPTVKKFLQPGSQQKPFEDGKCVEELKSFFCETGQDFA